MGMAMDNIFISTIYLLLTFALTILCFKKYGKYGLYIWMCVLVIISNIQTIKIAEVFNLTISLGNISYGALFLTTDILSEKYGKKATDNATKFSFIIMVVFSILMYIFLQYKPSDIDSSQNALMVVFGYIPRITFASLSAFYISQRCDAYLYKILKQKYNKIWISNNVSTIISQTIDTLLFVFISFTGIMDLKNMFQLIITMLLFKWVIALLDTPFMILTAKINNNELE